MTFMSQIQSVISLMSKKEKIRFVFLIIGSMLLGVIEVLGVSSIMPFIAVASQPELIQTNEYLFWAYTFFGFTSDKSFLLALGLLLFVFVLLRNIYLALYTYAQTHYTSMRRHSLSLKLFHVYISQRYPFFLNKNSYDFVKNINIEIERMINGTLMQLVNIICYLFQILLLTAFLFYVNTFVTLSITLILVSVYALVYIIIKKEVHSLGVERYKMTSLLARIVNEAFWGIKETKITGCEQTFIDSYTPPSKKFSHNFTKEEVINIIPKYILEVVSFSSILVLIFIMVGKSENFSEVISSISVYAYAGYRLMPSVQSVFRSFNKFKYSMPAAQKIVQEFNYVYNEQDNISEVQERLPFFESITMQNISFAYDSNKQKKVLDAITLSIPANSLVGFTGKTGSGKTTLVDILLGLLVPDEGSILIDGKEVSKKFIRSWQKNLGYVPQNIFLSNDTIAANIAFGVMREEIDMNAVRQAACMAQIDDFIQNELPERYNTLVGERGVRLSGGQRQRIGIARALYRDPSVLVMDEATSALDNQTEIDVMKAIDGLSGKKTIIMIAHRLSTLKKCDVIFDLENGQIVRSGKYGEIFGS